MVQKMLKEGVRGYLLKTDSMDDFKMAVDEVLNGRVFISRNIVAIKQ
jgi:DNA-binding NarL/FixJ family response regulator